MPIPWDDWGEILRESKFQSYDYPTKLRIANNYFNDVVLKQPEFRTMHPEARERVYREFISTIPPATFGEKMQQFAADYETGARKVYGEAAPEVTEFLKNVTWGYAPVKRIEPTVKTPLRRATTTAAGLLGLGLGILLPTKLPFIGAVARPALTTPIRMGRPVISGALSGARTGLVHGFLSKPEEGQTRKGRAVGEAAMFGAFGAAEGALTPILTKHLPIVKNVMKKLEADPKYKPTFKEQAALSAMETYKASMLGGGAGALEPAQNLQERLQNIGLGMLGFGLAHVPFEGLGLIESRRPFTKPKDLLKTKEEKKKETPVFMPERPEEMSRALRLQQAVSKPKVIIPPYEKPPEPAGLLPLYPLKAPEVVTPPYTPAPSVPRLEAPPEQGVIPQVRRLGLEAPSKPELPLPSWMRGIAMPFRGKLPSLLEKSKPEIVETKRQAVRKPITEKPTKAPKIQKIAPYKTWLLKNKPKEIKDAEKELKKLEYKANLVRQDPRYRQGALIPTKDRELVERYDELETKIKNAKRDLALKYARRVLDVLKAGKKVPQKVLDDLEAIAKEYGIGRRWIKPKPIERFQLGVPTYTEKKPIVELPKEIREVFARARSEPSGRKILSKTAAERVEEAYKAIQEEKRREKEAESQIGVKPSEEVKSVDTYNQYIRKLKDKTEIAYARAFRDFLEAPGTVTSTPFPKGEGIHPKRADQLRADIYDIYKRIRAKREGTIKEVLGMMDNPVAKRYAKSVIGAIINKETPPEWKESTLSLTDQRKIKKALRSIFRKGIYEKKDIELIKEVRQPLVIRTEKEYYDLKQKNLLPKALEIMRRDMKLEGLPDSQVEEILREYTTKFEKVKDDINKRLFAVTSKRVKDVEENIRKIEATASREGWSNKRLEKELKPYRNKLRSLQDTMSGADANDLAEIMKLGHFMKISPEELIEKYGDVVDTIIEKKPKGRPTKKEEELKANKKIRDTLSKILDKDIIDEVLTLEERGEKKYGLQEERQRRKEKVGKAASERETSIKKAVDTVATLVGGIAEVELKPEISSATAEALRRHGWTEDDLIKTKVIIGGKTSIVNGKEFKALIQLATESPKSDIVKRAAHEAWEVIQRLLLTPTELNIIRNKFRKPLEEGEPRKVWSERAADAFAEFYTGGGEKGTIRRIFNKISSFFERLKNALAGKGFTSVESIFTSAKKGEMVRRASEYMRTDADRRGFLEKTEDPSWMDMFLTVEPAEKVETAKGKKIDLMSDLEKRVREIHSKYFTQVPADKEDMRRYHHYLKLPYWAAKKWPKLRPIIQRLLDSYEKKSDFMVSTFEALDEPLFKITGDRLEKLREVIIESDAEDKIIPRNYRADPSKKGLEERLNNDEGLIKAYYRIGSVMRDVMKKKIKATTMNLLEAMGVDKKPWYDIYLNDYLFGNRVLKANRYEEVLKRVEKQFGRDAVEEVKKINEDPLMYVTEPILDKDGNPVLDANGVEKTQNIHIRDAITELMRKLGRKYYFPRMRGDGNYFAEIIRANIDDPKDTQTEWRKQTDWKPFRMLEKKQLKTLEKEAIQWMENTAKEAEKEGHKIIEFNKPPQGKEGNAYLEIEAKDGKRYKYTIKTDKMLQYPDTLFPQISIDAMAQFIRTTTDSLRARGKIDPKAAAEFAHTMIQAVKYDLMARSKTQRHMIPRKYKRTLGGDLAAVEGYETKDITKVYINYIRRVSNYVGKSYFKMGAFNLLSAIHPNREKEMYEYGEKYIKGMLTPQSNADRVVNFFRSVAFGYYMGFNIRPAVIQLTQNLLLGAPWLARRMAGGKGKKFLHFTLDAERELARAAADVFKYRKSKQTGQQLLSPLEIDALDKLKLRGPARAQYFEQLIGEITSQTGGRWDKIKRKMGWLFSEAEIYNRELSGLAMYRVAMRRFLEEGLVDKLKAEFMKEGGLSEKEAEIKASQVVHEAAIKEAGDFIHDTHFLMGKPNIPLPMLGGSISAAGLRGSYTFRTFTHNFFESMLYSLRDTDGKLALDVVFRSLAYLFLLGGLSGLPFVDDLLDRYEKYTGKSIRTQVGQAISHKDTPLKIGIFAGIPAIVGADISGSLRFGLPEFSLKGFEETVFGVFGGLSDKIDRAVKALEMRDWRRAVESGTPAAGENLLKAFRLYSEGATTLSGRKILSPEGKQVKLTETEAILQGLGLRPTKLSKISRVKNISYNVEKFYNKRRNIIYSKLRKAKTAGDLRKVIKEINAFNRGAVRYGGGISLITPTSIKQATRDRLDKLMRVIGQKGGFI